MENVINTMRVPQEDKHEPVPPSENIPEINPEPVPTEAAEETDKPVRRVRQPLLRRRGNLLLMGLGV